MGQKTKQINQRSHRAYLIFSLLCAAYLLVYFHRLAPNVVALDLMKDLNTGSGLFGVLASAYFYPYALMQLPAGLLADGWGARKTICSSFCLAALGSFVFAWAQTPLVAILARIMVGLGVSLCFVPALKVLTRWFTAAQFAALTGFILAIGGLGVFCATTPLAYLTVWLSWRGSFVFMGMLTFLVAVLVWFLVRDTPEEMGFPPVALPLSGPEAGQPQSGIKDNLGLILKSPAFWLLCIWFFFHAGIFFGFAGLWGGPYLMQVYGMTKPQAGNALSFIALGMIASGILMGRLSARYPQKRKVIVVFNTSMLTLFCTQPSLFPGLLPAEWMPVWCLGFGFFSSASPVLVFSMLKEIFPLSMTGTVTGLINLSPFLGGALIQPLIGYILEADSNGGGVVTAQAYGEAFMVFLPMGGIAVLTALLLRLPGKDNQVT
ncbi:MFS transporter [Dethiosulfatarculus sandiegensis]|uniref:Major facilitator superfamily (MFS) profile domain-containing protein n=1 Tax=Dethiosulfatarculus sandiegensis TaxID=1429043 RepID=A0A0D2HSF6_9BACT|nr:MFS transporter [Dethiosulfatarculus sandiegensis]KIX13453.1 hypothetical protein X474_13290 [Dethiosulfatarculus sandiegensis]